MKSYTHAWEEVVTLPTYEAGKPEKNPMFLEKRVYQGSSGSVYPHPVIEKIHDEKLNKEYRAFFLENEYLKIMVLPELGGRIYRAWDKIRNRDFVYYNEVIKPALVGLTGPWISGGIEFNWPQHHRPTTFEPIDCCMEENTDGSITVWVNEVEIMTHTKGMAGFTLYPGKAFLEVKVRIFNPTRFPQSFLWWANPAVSVNEFYQAIFPPDVYAVFDHGRRDTTSFPVATGTYYKVDYSPGTDISRYINIPVPTSYMAIHSGYDFIGCYMHDEQAGMLHVANHHISPGKKQWTWGNGDFGKAWDRNLTDGNGPYVELMTGVFTDNQPDFTWLQPNEQKEFQQYFMPFAKTGGIKNATKEAVLNLEIDNSGATIKVYTSAVYPSAKISLFVNHEIKACIRFDLSPEHVFEERIELVPGIAEKSIRITVEDGENNLLVCYQTEPAKESGIPEPASAAKLPADIQSIEELWLTGQHLEQYRHATFNPVDYYGEALRRDTSDNRSNTAMGLLLLRRGQFRKAEVFFRKAIERITKYNSNPANGEAYFYLGCCLELQGSYPEAFASFYKSVWNDAWQHSGFLALARIASRQGQWAEALQLVDRSLAGNTNSPSARQLKISLLRKLGKQDEALECCKESVAADPFNYGVHFEHYLLLLEMQQPRDADEVLNHMQSLAGCPVTNYFGYALEWAAAGFTVQAMGFLERFAAAKNNRHPLVYYYLGWLANQQEKQADASAFFKRASTLPTEYCFPNRAEEIIILEKAIELNPTDANALYYLGNLWYDKRQYEQAINCWERSRELNPYFPTVHRNLALAYFNKVKDPDRSLAAMEKSFSLDKTDARVLMELDQLYKTLNKPVAWRLEFFENNLDAVYSRDDLYLELITLYNLKGEFEKAGTLLLNRKFHPWEGGEGKVIEEWLICHLELAKLALLEDRYEDALNLLSTAQNYPHSLGEGKLFGKPENDIHYLEASAYEYIGDAEKAKLFFEKAAMGLSEPAQAIFYNDPQPDKIFYQGLAEYKLGDYKKAQSIFRRFISFSEEHRNDEIRINYFAVSLPDLLVFEQDLQEKNRVHCEYLAALGHLGLGDFEKARNLLSIIVEQQNHHAGASIHLAMIKLLSKPVVVHLT